MFKIFSKAARCDANPDPDPWVRIRKKIHQNRKCKWFRIRMWSGSANRTKLNANASGSGFLIPDSGIFYADPRFASDPYHTVRIPSSGSDWARTSLVCKGTRHLDHPWGAGNAMPCSRTMPSRSGKSQTRKYHVYHYHLTVNFPWTYPAWKGIYFSPASGFGGFSQDD
jgi:hypothetical protein